MTKPSTPGACPTCGSSFDQAPTGRTKLFCSDSCRRNRPKVLDEKTGKKRYATPAELEASRARSRRFIDQANAAAGEDPDAPRRRPKR